MNKKINKKIIYIFAFAFFCFFMISGDVYALDECTKLEGIKKYIVMAFKLLRFVVPALIIVLSVLDFVGVVASGEDDKMEKAKKHFVTRLVVGIVILLLPALLEVILKMAHLIDNGQSLADSVCNVIE